MKFLITYITFVVLVVGLLVSGAYNYQLWQGLTASESRLKASAELNTELLHLAGLLFGF